MTENTAPTHLDETGIEQFADRLVTDLAAAATTATTVIGDRLGLYTAMTGAGPLTAPALAAAAALDERLVAEWLAAQATAGYLSYDPEEQTFELPTEHAMVLAEPESPAYLVAATGVIAAQYLTLDQLAGAFHTGGGLDYGVFPPSLFEAIERFFRTAYVHQLPTTWFPAVPGLVERLEAGASVADVGCGHGIATLLMAERWPRSAFTGIDFHEPSIATARAKALEAGSPGNVVFRSGDATELGPGPYDVVVFLDSLHDLGDPVAALRRAHASLREDGIVLAVEPWSADDLELGIGNPVARMNYAISTSVCTPGALGQPGGHALGTSGGPGKRVALLAEAGFRDAFVAADTGLNLVVAATK